MMREQGLGGGGVKAGEAGEDWKQRGDRVKDIEMPNESSQKECFKRKAFNAAAMYRDIAEPCTGILLSLMGTQHWYCQDH